MYEYKHTWGITASRDGRNEREASDDGIKSRVHYAFHMFSSPWLSGSLPIIPNSDIPTTAFLRPQQPGGGTVSSFAHDKKLSLVFLILLFSELYLPSIFHSEVFIWLKKWKRWKKIWERKLLLHTHRCKSQSLWRYACKWKLYVAKK